MSNASQPEAGTAAMTVSDLTILFHGAGSMAEAIVRGMLAGGLTRPERIVMSNRSNAERLAELAERYRVRTAGSDAERARALAEADIIVLGMKPKDADTALRGLSGIIREDQLIVSVIAGLSTGTIAKLIGRTVPIARTMPNTSSTIGQGATGITFSARVSSMQREHALAIFRAVGVTAVVEEPLIDAVTALSGSGPAYIYYAVEAMIEAAAGLGLPAAEARELAVQTVLGAAMMLKETGEDPAELRRKVTSPGGTTQAAIETLERLGFDDALAQAMRRAAERAAEMGAQLERSATT